MWTIAWHEHPEKRLNFKPYSNKAHRYKDHTKVWGEGFQGPLDPPPKIHTLNHKIMLDGKANIFPTEEARAIWNDLTHKGWVPESDNTFCKEFNNDNQPPNLRQSDQ